MSLIRKAAALAGVLTLVVAGAAFASATKVTGGSAKITVSTAAVNMLTANHITAKVIAPATESGATFTFPIARGSVNTTNLRGTIFTRGGVTLSNGTKTGALRDVTIRYTKQGDWLYALVRADSRRCRLTGARHLHLRCVTIVSWSIARIATVTGVTVSGSSASGTVQLTERTADLINRLAGKTVASAGTVLGTATVAPTLK